MRRLVLTAVLVGLVGACSDSGLEPSTTSSVVTTMSIPMTTVAPPTTTETVDSDILLQANGLGAVDFGDPVEEVVAKLEAALGPATHQEQYAPHSPSRTEFEVYWEESDLLIGFSTFPWFRSDGALHFTWWDMTTFSPPVTLLTTAAGVGWGSTLGDLEDAYGERLEIQFDECTLPAVIDSGIFVDFDRPAGWTEDGSLFYDDPDSTLVRSMRAGVSDGC